MRNVAISQYCENKIERLRYATVNPLGPADKRAFKPLGRRPQTPAIPSPQVIKEKHMKRTALTGLFLSAALLASPVFAADDLC
ncbi:hypothetical protein GIW00_28565, partial [Pseudomonas syringae]|nr:hypothetical protein [Pseudomonas syringae]